MSLILDALRRADAERERGSVPSLHSQPVVAPSLRTLSTPTVRPNWLWIAVGAALGLAVAATWVMTARNAPAPSAVTKNAAPVPPGMPEPAPVRPPVVSAPSLPAGTATDAQPIAEPAPWPQPSAIKGARADAKNDPPVRTLGNVLPAEAPVYSRDQLPPEIRAALPQITIGGNVYSPDPAARSLIVNGRLVREKERLSDDLSVEEIKLRAAVFRFRGYRFEVLF
ncbi:MAG TPA: general secretion pathway protein GspB [Burkholderiaceae bacterium]|nr:general secretion pathway protein GspB [Burkholderiaceae bacterium]